jgi:hypothetical protein
MYLPTIKPTDNKIVDPLMVLAAAFLHILKPSLNELSQDGG